MSIHDNEHEGEHLLEFLLHVVRDSALDIEPKIKLSIDMPIRKTLTSLGVRTVVPAQKKRKTWSN